MAGHLVQFPDDQDILFCRICETHLALENHVIVRSEEELPDPFALIKKMVNVVLDPSLQVVVTCQNCAALLGTRVLPYYSASAANPVFYHRVYTRRLNLRAGGVVRNAHSQIPIDGNWRSRIKRYSTRDGNFYKCRQCQTHIAKQNDHMDSSTQFKTFSKADNIYKGCSYTQKHKVAAPVYCKVCYTRLGRVITDPPTARPGPTTTMRFRFGEMYLSGPGTD